jgi:hypothetical protein
MKKYRAFLLNLAIATGFIACQGQAENSTEGSGQGATQAEEFITEVEANVMQTSTFTREL